MATFRLLFLVGAVAGDPCTQLCDIIPGACSEGSICTHSICTNLYWMNYSRLICNSSNGGCDSGGLPAVACAEAEGILASNNARRVVSFLSTRAADGIEETGDAWFAPGRSVGRKGFKNMARMSSHIGSTLQILLHSRVIREGIRDDLMIGSSGRDRAHPFRNEIYFEFVALLNALYSPTAETTELSLDDMEVCTESFVIFDESARNPRFDPLEFLRHIFFELSHVSTRIFQALPTRMRLWRRCPDCGSSALDRCLKLHMYMSVQVPPRDGSISIKQLFIDWLGKPDVDDGFGCCRANDCAVEQVPEQWSVSEAPRLLTFSIDRNSSADRVETSLDTPNVLDLSGIVERGEEVQYRMLGIVRNIGEKFVVDYFDAEAGEWIYADGDLLHVIQDRPRNGGSDAVLVVYERV